MIVIAATNFPESLDKALVRPGRFDRHVTVPNPDVRGREQILEAHTRNMPLASDVKLAVSPNRHRTLALQCASGTPMLSGGCSERHLSPVNQFQFLHRGKHEMFVLCWVVFVLDWFSLC